MDECQGSDHHILLYFQEGIYKCGIRKCGRKFTLVELFGNDSKPIQGIKELDLQNV